MKLGDKTYLHKKGSKIWIGDQEQEGEEELEREEAKSNCDCQPFYIRIFFEFWSLNFGIVKPKA